MTASGYYLGVITPAVVLVPIGVAVHKYAYWGRSEKIVFCYLVFSAIFNVLAVIAAHLYKNNLPLLHLYSILEFFLLSYLFKSFFQGGKVNRWLSFLPFSFSLLAVLYVFCTHSLFRYNSIPRFVSSIIILSFCLYFLFIDLTRIENNQSTFNFIIVVGLMIYFSSCSILFGLSQVTINNIALSSFLWKIHATIMAIMYLLFAFAFTSLKKAK